MRRLSIGRAAMMIAAILLMTELCACSAAPVTRQSFALDTFISVTVYDGGSDAAEAALSCIDQREKLLSAHLEDSDLSRLNQADAQTFVPVDPMTAALISSALEIGKKSGGTLDITLYSVSELWDYKSEHPRPPEAEQIQRALMDRGMEKIRIQGDSVCTGGARIDLGAVAKGAIGDDALSVLQQRNVRCALLNLGGNILTLGNKPDGKPWRIAVDSPFESGITLGTIAFSGSRSVATSSGAQRYFVWEEKTYHHILDPETGMPAQSGLASVTVLAETGKIADGLSTALFVAGEEKAEEILAQFPGTAAVLVRQDGSIVCCGEIDFSID